MMNKKQKRILTRGTEETEEEEEEQTIMFQKAQAQTPFYEIKGPHPEEQTVTLTANGGDLCECNRRRWR